MSFKHVKSIPTPMQIMEEIPMPAELKTIKSERDAELREIIEGKNDRFVVIAVSYTHLDVYKRQSHGMFNIICVHVLNPYCLIKSIASIYSAKVWPLLILLRVWQFEL